MKIIFYDNECGLCGWAVRFILKRDHKKLFFFAPLSGKTAKKRLQQWRYSHPNVDSIVLLETDGSSPHLTFYSGAILRIAWLLGFPWSCFGWVSFLPSWMLVPADVIYRFIARHRRQVCSLQNFNHLFYSDTDHLLP